MLQTLLYSLPALVVLAATWLVMHKLFTNEQLKREWELKRLSQKEISPIRLRAYERLTLLLERTTPEHLLTDADLQTLSIPQLQQLMLRTLRLEFEHNLSQQIYVSQQVWDLIINARDQMGAFITAMPAQAPQGTNTIQFAQLLITAYHQNGETPHQIALQALKDEAAQLL